MSRLAFRSALLIAALAFNFAAHAAEPEIDYETKFEGVAGSLKSELRGASQLVQLEDKPPDTESALRRRADGDLARLKQVLDAEGYYDSAVTVDVAPEKEPDHFTVTVHVEPGARYTVAEVKIVQPDGTSPPEIRRFLPAAFGVERGKPALSAPVTAAEGKIAHAYAERGWPFAKIANLEVVIDTATKGMFITYTLDTGKPALFGATRIEGLKRLDKAYVERRIGWRRGLPYNQAAVDDTHQTLVTSGLFGLVKVQPAGPVAADGTVSMLIQVDERSLHTITGGGSYDTSLGISAHVSWEDRDLFGHAEDLLITAKGGSSDSGLTAKFTRPDAFWFQQDFVASATFENELQDAFRSLHQQLQLGFQQHFTPTITGGYAIEGEHARVDEKIDFRTYTMIGVPLFIRQDASNDLLNPTRGYRAGLELTPFIGIKGAGSYAQARLTASAYRKIDDQGNYILAVQGILGASCCAALDDLPKDHRLYAGGGGTIRGFGYQKAGPLDQYYNPIGGRSMLVGSFELRTMLTDSLQLVPFMDAGSDYQSILPDLGSKIYVGSGIGVRYFTPIGPIRFDVATPLDPHSKGDSLIQVYVSIGQAF